MTASAIEERGEHELVLAGRPYLLRPSHAAMRAIEQKTGRSTLELLRLGNSGGLSLDHLGIVAAELVRAGADGDITRMVDAGRMSELIYEEGLHRTIARLTLVLVEAASGGRTASGEARAAPETSGDAGAA